MYILYEILKHLVLRSRNKVDQQSLELFKQPEHIHLFVRDVLDFSSQYGKENSNSYTVVNIRSRPHYYPKYGDFLGILHF